MNIRYNLAAAGISLGLGFLFGCEDARNGHTANQQPTACSTDASVADAAAVSDAGPSRSLDAVFADAKPEPEQNPADAEVVQPPRDQDRDDGKNPECRRLIGGYNFASEETLNTLIAKARGLGPGFSIYVTERDLEADSAQIERVVKSLENAFEQLGMRLGDIRLPLEAMAFSEKFYMPIERTAVIDDQPYALRFLDYRANSRPLDNNNNDNARWQFTQRLRFTVNGGVEQERVHESTYTRDWAPDGEFIELLSAEQTGGEAVYAFVKKYQYQNAVFDSLDLLLASQAFVDTKVTIRAKQDNVPWTYEVQLPDGSTLPFTLRLQDDIEHANASGLDIFVGGLNAEENQYEQELYPGDYRTIAFNDAEGQEHVVSMVLRGTEEDADGKRYAVIDVYGSDGQYHEIQPLDFKPRVRHERYGDACPEGPVIYVGYCVPETNVPEGQASDEIVRSQPGAVRVAAQKSGRPLPAVSPNELEGLCQSLIDHHGAFLDTSSVLYQERGMDAIRYPQIVISGLPSPEEPEDDVRRRGGNGNEIPVDIGGEEEKPILGPERALQQLFLLFEDILN